MQSMKNAFLLLLLLLLLFFVVANVFKQVRLRHQLLDPLLKSHLQLYEKIRANALNRLKVDGMEKDAKLVDPNSAYCKDPEKYAMHSFAYYICFKCKKAYFGGRRDCEQNMLENRDPSEQICFDCGGKFLEILLHFVVF